jgi:hypothetical protein
MPPKKLIKESDLYPPLHDYLVANGYTVRSEVVGCDIAATKGDDLVLIEIKRNFTTSLLAQAVRRLNITPSVYVAIPKPNGRMSAKQWRGTKMVLRRLELGLVVVNLRSKPPRVDLEFHPGPFSKRVSKQKRHAVLKEMNGRSLDLNRGGSSQTRLVTAYRENAIHIACCLERYGAMRPAAMRKLETGPKTTNILYDNVYGWFDRVGRGVYELRPKGKKALREFPDLAAFYRERLDTLPKPDGVDVDQA